jgi:hypothetical protein
MFELPVLLGGVICTRQCQCCFVFATFSTGAWCSALKIMGFTFFLKENLAIYGISPELSALIIAHLKWESCSVGFASFLKKAHQYYCITVLSFRDILYLEVHFSCLAMLCLPLWRL